MLGTMTGGGSLSVKGSGYIKKLREVDKVLTFLDKIKEEVNSDEKVMISEVMRIISNHFKKAHDLEE
jgi:hypothetical protein